MIVLLPLYDCCSVFVSPAIQVLEQSELGNNLKIGNNTVQRSERDESVAQSKSIRSRKPTKHAWVWSTNGWMTVMC